MPRRRSLESELDELDALRADPTSDTALAALRRALGRTSLVAARAARIVGDAELTELEPSLLEAFARFFDAPARSDKGCAARMAIARAACQLGTDCETLFLRGARHVQREPVFGGTVDTAAALRGHCAMGLAGLNRPDVMIVLADLLADQEAATRAAAAGAIAATGRAGEGVPLLRCRALSGDDDPTALGECFAALMRLAPETSVPFVATFLTRGTGTDADAAAMALGSTRRPDAHAALRAWFEELIEPDARRSALVAMALIRSPASDEHLLSLLADAPLATALAVVEAMALHRYDRDLAGRLAAAVQARGEGPLREAFKAAFGAAPCGESTHR